MFEIGVIIKLVVAALLGALLGFERQSSKKHAGLRTHVILALASCVLVVVVGEAAPQETARIIAGIVTGMGFIGAGAIMSIENKVKGITTAASLWVVTIIGIIVGLGIYDIAVITTFLVLIVLWLGKFEHKKKLK